MASLPTQYFFPHFPPPSPTSTPPPAPVRPSLPPPHIVPPPPHTFSPPPPHLVPPPSPPHFSPPPPHKVPPPPPPPHIVPPPPHILPPPPPPPGNHSTIIVVVFVSCGGVFFLAFVMAALWCFLKKRKKKMVRKAENIHFDEHRKVAERIVEGPHGTQSVILSVEDDIHIQEDIKKSEIDSFRKGMHLNSGDTYNNVGPADPGKPSSSSGHHHHLHG